MESQIVVSHELILCKVDCVGRSCGLLLLSGVYWSNSSLSLQAKIVFANSALTWLKLSVRFVRHHGIKGIWEVADFWATRFV